VPDAVGSFDVILLARAMSRLTLTLVNRIATHLSGAHNDTWVPLRGGFPLLSLRGAAGDEAISVGTGDCHAPTSRGPQWQKSGRGRAQLL